MAKAVQDITPREHDVAQQAIYTWFRAPHEGEEPTQFMESLLAALVAVWRIRRGRPFKALSSAELRQCAKRADADLRNIWGLYQEGMERLVADQGGVDDFDDGLKTRMLGVVVYLVIDGVRPSICDCDACRAAAECSNVGAAA